jgi:hypothetical protein
MADLEVRNEGSIFLLWPRTDLGREWLAEHIPDDATTFGAAVVVEHRYIAAIVEGATGDGLEVK